MKILFAILLTGCVHVVDTTWSGHRQEIEDKLGIVMVFTGNISEDSHREIVVCVTNKFIEIADRNQCVYDSEKDIEKQSEICFKTGEDRAELSQCMVKCIQDVMFKEMLK